MGQRPVGLIASAGQEELVRAICDHTEIAAVLNLGRARLSLDPVPVLREMEEFLDCIVAGTCCYLSPGPSLKRGLLACVEHRVNVLSAGPISLSRSKFDYLCQSAVESKVRLSWGNQYPFSGLFQALHAQSRKPEFGNPVYLRQVRGGGQGLLSAWWAACESLDQALAILGAPLRNLLVAAFRQGSQHHVVLTVGAENQSNAQLVIAPVHLPFHHDITLLGTGGLLFSDGVSNASPLILQDRIQLHPHTDQYPEPAWLVNFLGQLDGPVPSLPDWSTLNLHNRILRAMRQALRQRHPIQVKMDG